MLKAKVKKPKNNRQTVKFLQAEMTSNLQLHIFYCEFEMITVHKRLQYTAKRKFEIFSEGKILKVISVTKLQLQTQTPNILMQLPQL